jgi:uncharacterized integral membrane protein
MMHDGPVTVIEAPGAAASSRLVAARRDKEDRTMRNGDDLGPDDRHRGEWLERREGPSTKLIVLAAVVVLLVVFVVQNTDRAQIDFLFWNGEFPLWTMIVVAAVLGLIGGWVIGRIGSAERRARDAERRLRDED